VSAHDPDLAQQRAELIRSARAYLEWETEVSAFGIPRTQVARAPRPAAQPAAAAPVSARLPAEQGLPPTGAPSSLPGAALVELAPAASLGSRAEEAGASTTPPVSAGGPTGTAPSDAGDRRARLAVLDQEVRGCARCELAKGRTQTVFARGNPDSPLMFIGEGPGQEEDRLGAPFVGAAGQLLDKMVGAMGFLRDDVYICNVVKCRPPGNRTPLPVEAQACAPYLLGQLDAVAPRVIVALGRCAAENMGLVAGGGWRGRWGRFRGVDVMPTYHPAFLLRSPEYKRPVWEDLQQVMTRLKQPG
jgi:uracil-DNA glycosylase